MVVDFKSQTTYYRTKDYDYTFKEEKDAIDSRKISSVSMLDYNDALVNISKNVFSLQLDKLEEIPLTGIGSFCIAMIKIRLATLPEIFLCLGDDSL